MSTRNTFSRFLSLLWMICMFMFASCTVATTQVGKQPTISQPSGQATPTAILLATQVFPIPQRTPDSLMPGLPPSAPIESYFTKTGESNHFRYYQDQGYQPVEQKKWIEQAEKVYEYVSHRLNLDVKEKIGVVVVKPDTGTCPSRGWTSGNFITINADQQTSEKQLLGILAHELGHAIRNSAAKDLLPANIALEEGMATWVAGNYWTDWHGFSSFDGMVKDYLQKSSYLPIYQYTNLEGTQRGAPILEGTQPGSSIQGDCLARRDILYSEWASFIDFLIRQYGMEKLDALFKSSRMETLNTNMIIYPPDYQGIYGFAINQLEAQWITSIR